MYFKSYFLWFGESVSDDELITQILNTIENSAPFTVQIVKNGRIMMALGYVHSSKEYGSILLFDYNAIYLYGAIGGGWGLRQTLASS